jgi:4-amino-4-deoxy-L-arabinose transferase-like glycosyltransferase
MAKTESPQSGTPWCKSPFWIAAIALLIRVGWIFLAHTYRFKTINDNFGFGFEMGRIARSLAAGEGFGNPFDGITGPTAWEPPVYPFLMAGVFKFFGIYTRASAMVMLCLSSVFSALTCAPIFLIGKRCFDERVALWSAWAWAVLPPIIFWCTRWVWETSLAALLLAVIFWLTICLDERARWTIWAGWGLLWGIAALTNTSLLGFLPAAGLWAWWRQARKGKSALVGIVWAVSMFALCVAPWIIRNERTFGKFIFVRSNFGAELRLGNGPGANGTWMDYEHPTKNADQFEEYKRLGESAYVAERKREAMEFIREDYGRLAWLSLKRFAYYWGGLPQPGKSLPQTMLKNAWLFLTSLLCVWGLWQALRKAEPRAYLFLWLLLFYPAVYYITFAHPRYRHPIEPEILLLAVYGLTSHRENAKNVSANG